MLAISLAFLLKNQNGTRFTTGYRLTLDCIDCCRHKIFCLIDKIDYKNISCVLSNVVPTVEKFWECFAEVE